MIYVDNAATSFPKPESVYQTLDRFARTDLANPGRAGHKMALAAERALDDCRHLLNQFFHGDGPERFIFTLNCTDALNMAFKGVLTAGDAHNEQIDAWQVVVIAANGDVTTFSPELMEIRSTAHNNFRFGNILEDDFDALFANEVVLATQQQIRRGVERCRAHCQHRIKCVSQDRRAVEGKRSN